MRSICHPGPKAITTVNGNKVSINRSEFIKDAPTYKGIPGLVLASHGQGRYMVKTVDSYVIISDVDFIDGQKIKIGDRLGT